MIIFINTYYLYLTKKLQRTHNGFNKQILKANAFYKQEKFAIQKREDFMNEIEKYSCHNLRVMF